MSAAGLMTNPNTVSTRRSHLRRTIIAITAIGALIAAGVAYAASFNTYSAKLSFSPPTAGTSSKPVSTVLKEALAAKSSTSGDRAAPLINIKVTMYGLKANPAGFPTCSVAKITAAKNDTGCPKGAMVASGPVQAFIGGQDLSKPGTPCDPLLHVWNGGSGTLVYFFVDTAGHTCGSLMTGSTAPWSGSLKPSGKNLVQNIPLPPDVSTSAGNLPGVYGSLVSLQLNWVKLTHKVKGKTVAFVDSVGCKKNSRPYSAAYTATNGSATQTSTVSGSSKC